MHMDRFIPLVYLLYLMEKRYNILKNNKKCSLSDRPLYRMGTLHDSPTVQIPIYVNQNTNILN